MQWFYDGQIRRYITQTIRVFSNFVVKYGDGTLHRIPVMYGDADRQAASIIRNNSENKVNSVPRIAVYVTALDIDRDRTADQTYVGKVHIRERDIENGAYTSGQGKNYTVERLMPTPFKLTMKVDIWSANTEQKLQIMEQILVLFNPSLELQTSDNYVDWTSLSTLNLTNISWDSRTVPVGADTPISIATLTIDTGIWISPPVKVKHLGVITKIITSLYQAANTSGTYIEGLGEDPMAGTTTFSTQLSQDIVTITGYHIQVYNSQARLMGPYENALPAEPNLEITIKQGPVINWEEAFAQYPGKYVAGSSQIYLIQPNGSAVVGTIAMDPLDSSLLKINWNLDTLTTNTGIDSSGNLDSAVGYYNLAASYRPNSPGTFDAIINPLTFNPKRPQNQDTDQAITAGTRYLIIEDIGSADNADGPDAWKSTTNVDFIAKANDIIEWTGAHWNVIFNSVQETTSLVWQTNIYTGVQYLWNGVSWVKSFEGEYSPGQWKIVL